VLTPKSIAYEVKPGDSLAKIAKEFKTTPELIMKSNKISGDKIFPGKKIKVWNAALNLVIDKSQNMLMLKSDDEIIKTYVVSTGVDNSTPAGAFKIINKIQNPTWFKAGTVVPAGSPDNILGTAWLGFNLPGYGIHGTIDPQNLGRQVTQGCIRMANADVEELYIIVPIDTEVTVVD
jgi:lipoprotein-anchoring transpeptidase ErfK/SrfK